MMKLDAEGPYGSLYCIDINIFKNRRVYGFIQNPPDFVTVRRTHYLAFARKTLVALQIDHHRVR